MQLRITIELGNDAIQDGYDAFQAIAKCGIAHNAGQPDDGTIRDDNGNTVGEWAIAPRPQPEPMQPEGSVRGTIRLNDGSTSGFALELPSEEGEALTGWQQWGATTERLGRTSELVEAMQAANYSGEISA